MIADSLTGGQVPWTCRVLSWPAWAPYRPAYTAPVAWQYRPDVLEELTRHGVVPTPATDPQVVRDFLSALYRYEIRRLKGRLLRGQFPQRDYAALVRLLRRQYVLLSIPLETWTGKA